MSAFHPKQTFRSALIADCRRRRPLAVREAIAGRGVGAVHHPQSHREDQGQSDDNTNGDELRAHDCHFNFEVLKRSKPYFAET